MNKKRRAEIEAIRGLIEILRNELEDHGEAVENLKDEESDYFDNMPESLQASERGERATEAADQLSEARDKITEAVDALEEALSMLDSSIE